MSISDSINMFNDLGKASPPKPNQPIKAVLEFFENNLPEFIYENSGKRIDEDSFTQNLCIILNNNAIDKLFWFQFQNKEQQKGNSPSIDIAVYTRGIIHIKNKSFTPKQRFFAFEAKILGINDKKREKEYVIGKQRQNGGIERFKRNIHGKDLPKTGMIGYIIKNDFNYWYKTVNEWIDELSNKASNTIKWETKDKLKKVPSSLFRVKKFNSIHSRIKNNSIQIYHYWIDLKP